VPKSRPLSMRSSQPCAVSIRPMMAADRPAVAGIVTSIENFNAAEIDCALELVDIYLQSGGRADYRFAVAEDSGAAVKAYACWGPTPLTLGTYDLYWLATQPDSRGAGFGRALMAYVESSVRREKGRLLVVETSSKESYGNTVRFYRNLGYEETSRIRDFYDVGDDKLILVKRLSR